MTDHLDVLIVGAGLSGIAAAAHLRREHPGRSHALLEGRDALGGTWDLFRYPGIRSDSDMFTLGFSFRPWTEAKAIADGPSILRYVQETADAEGVTPHIRFGHHVNAARWSSEEQVWTVEADTADGPVELTCSFLFACTGYFRYDQGHTPPLPGLDRFRGRLVHPQHWPEDLDWTGKRVVVVGSGATAVTLVPAMAPGAAHVTMLQRTPSYMIAMPAHDPIADALRALLPAGVAHPVIRLKNAAMLLGSYAVARRAPRLVRRGLMGWARRLLPAGYDMKHFDPPYDPWDQRLCLVPSGDLFKAVRSGRADVVTDTIAEVTERGVRLGSGRELPADVLITATGLDLLALGGMALSVDGEEVDLGATLTWRGAMLDGVPNLALALGYVNASWTLRCELVCRLVNRVLGELDARGAGAAIPRAGGQEAAAPFLDLAAGYVQRAVHRLPKQGVRDPWRVHQSWFRERRDFTGPEALADLEWVPAGEAQAAGRRRSKSLSTTA